MRPSARALMLFRPYWKPALWLLLLTLLSTCVVAVEPLVQKYLFDKLAGPIPGHGATSAEHFIFWAVIAMGLVITLGETVALAANYFSWKLRLRVNQRLLDAVVTHIYNLSLSYHQHETIASLRTRIDKAVNGFCSVLFDMTFSILPSALYLVCTIFFMLSLSRELSVVALFFAPLPAIIGIFAGRISSRREKVLLDRWVSIFSRFHETLSLIKSVKSFVMEDSERTKFLGEVDSTNNIVRRGVGVDSLFNAGKNMALAAARLSVLGYGALLVVQGHTTVGTLVAFLSYTGGLSGPVIGLAGIYESYKKGQVYLTMLFEILDTPKVVEDKEGAATLGRVQGNVEFQNVGFSYEPTREILKDISFSIPAGSTVALVGPSGSGKTTIIDLLNRFYDPARGRILVDGVDIRDVTQNSLRKNIGMVLQDTALFNDTVRNNIAIADLQASDEQIQAAAKAASADRFIAKLSNGYDTEVGERGACLSGGERQRIAIARAILKNPPILVFDEASSNLDSESEAIVQEAIEQLSGNKTLMIIAHRLSTIKRADVILVIENGKVVESGKHDDLVKAGGTYSRLVSLQSMTASH